jgi:hypothetical protein
MTLNKETLEQIRGIVSKKAEGAVDFPRETYKIARFNALMLLDVLEGLQSLEAKFQAATSDKAAKSGK